MNHEILLIIYLVILAVQIFSLVKTCRSNRLRHWIMLLCFEIGTAALSLVVMHYYNTHPGYMLSTLGHVLWSMGAAVCYAFIAALTGIMFLLHRIRQK